MVSLSVAHTLLHGYHLAVIVALDCRDQPVAVLFTA